MQSILIHHQDGVILIFPQQPIYLTVIVLQQAYFIHTIPLENIVEPFIVRQIETSQRKIQPIRAYRNEVGLPFHHIALPRSGTQEPTDIQQFKFLTMQNLRHTAIHLSRPQIHIEYRPQVPFIVCGCVLQRGVVQYFHNTELQLHEVMLRKLDMPALVNLIDDLASLIHHTDFSRLEAHALHPVLPRVKYLCISFIVIHISVKVNVKVKVISSSRSYR